MALANRLLVALLTLIVCLLSIRLFDSEPSTFGLHTVFAVVALGALCLYLITLYSLSRALDPKRSTAIVVVVLQIIPIIGVPLAVSMIIKGKRAAVNAGVPSANASASDA
jgi:hypothetical protein